MLPARLPPALVIVAIILGTNDFDGSVWLPAVLKWGPTSANTSPTRFIFLRSTKAKERLRPALSPGNVEKTMTAPVTVIIAYDLKFYEKLPRLFPHNPAMRDVFAKNPQLVENTAKRNSSLQGAYMMRLETRRVGNDRRSW